MTIIMDKQFEHDVDTFFSERYNDILIKVRKEIYQHSMLIKEITIAIEKLKLIASEETWSSIENLLSLLTLQNQTESKYLYIQGMEDCKDVFHFLKTKYVDQDYNELQLGTHNDNQ